MTFSENTNLLPGGQSASPSKLKELDNKIDDLAQTVTSVADSVADLADEVTTAELNATSANVTNAVIDNATVGEETVTTVNATTANADNLNATDADITNLTADDVEANSVDADNGYFGSVNAQSFTGQGVNITGDITASAKVQGKTVQATEKVVTPALESTQTELKGATTVRGDVYFPENGDKIYGEYLEIEADKVKADIEADTVKINSLTTETPTGSSQLVGYDANGNLIPVDAGLDPSNYWEQVPNPDPETVHFIKPKDNKSVQAPAVMAEYIAGMTKIDGVEVVAGDLRAVDTLTVEPGCETTLKDTEVDGDLTVNGDIIQNGSAYETHAEKVYSKNDLIITRDGAVSGLSTGQYTGIQAKKYDGTNDGQLVFDKDGEARVGDVGDTEPLMTRDELADMTNGSLLKWDGTNKKAVCDKSADIIPSDASTSNKLATTDSVNTALANNRRINISNAGTNFVYRYILLQPTAQSYEKNAEFTFNIFIWRSGISSSKIIKIDFMSSYDANEGQCIVQCGLRSEQNSVEFAKIVKVTYNNVEYFALKVYVYEYSQTIIYYTQSVPQYTSNLLYKILTPEEVTEGATVTFTTMFQNGEKILTESDLTALSELKLAQFNDCNNIKPSAKQRVIFAETTYLAANAPTGSNYWAIKAFILSNAPACITQIAVSVDGTLRKTRFYNGSTWSSWA